MTPSQEVHQILTEQHCTGGLSLDDVWEEITTVGTKPEFVHLMARLASAGDVDRRKLSDGLFRYWAKDRCPPHIKDAPNGTEQPDRHALPNPRTEKLQQIRQQPAATRQVSPAEAAYVHAQIQPPAPERQIDRLVKAVLANPGWNCKQISELTGIPVNSAATQLATACREKRISRSTKAGILHFWPPGEAPADEPAEPKRRTDIRAPATPNEIARADVGAAAAVAKGAGEPPTSRRIVAGFVIEDRPIAAHLVDGITGQLVEALGALQVGQHLVIEKKHGETHNAREQLYLRARRRLPGKKFTTSRRDADVLRVGRVK